MRLSNKLIITNILALTLMSCAKERDTKQVISNGRRVAKSAFKGDFHYLKTLAQLESPGKENRDLIRGMYQDKDTTIRFALKETSLDVISTQVRFEEYESLQSARTRGQELNTIIASFPIRHVDVLKKQNPDGQDTHEEEVTDTRRAWEEREFIELNAEVSDSLSPFNDSTAKLNTPGGIELDSNGAINFGVERQLKDNTVVKESYSFLPSANSNFESRNYPLALERSFGFFKTTVYQRDAYNRILQADKKVLLNRWNLSKPIVYYLSKDFPESLIPGAEKVFEQWNKAFEEASGMKQALVLKRNTGQTIGDLRYNMIHYDASADSSHGVLGYGPSTVDPVTGEIVKADVILFGGLLKRVLHREREWEAIRNEIEIGRSGGGESKGKNPFLLFGSPAHTVGFENIEEPEQLASMLSSQAKPDDTLLKSLAVKESLKNTLASERQSLLTDLRHSVTRLEGGVLESIAATIDSKKSDAELEQQIFIPLLAHELGHNLGLRHNFMGSADSKHFDHSHSSSVMDYHFLSHDEPQGPGSYDKAAIRAAYGAVENVPGLIAQNFYYCTDENTYDSRFGLCHQFDTGTSLTEMVEQQTKRYFQSYKINNIYSGEEFFGSREANAGYRSRVQRSLIPIRLAYDNANAIEDAFNSLRQESDPKEPIVQLWTLLGQRIEADASTKPENTVKLSMGGTLTIQIDLTKLGPAAEDAIKAKQAAFLAMMQILLADDTNRPHLSQYNPLNNEQLIRGVLFDKMFAILLLGSKMQAPANPGVVVSPLDTMDDNLGTSLFSYLLSNTFPAAGPLGTQTKALRIFDINLRLMARFVLEEEIAMSGSAGSYRELLALNKVVLRPDAADPDTANFKQIEAQRAKIVSILADIIRGGLPAKERAAKIAEVELLLLERDQVPVAFTKSVNSEFFMAPTENSDIGLTTTTGLLIKNEVNLLEDRVAALVKLRDEAKAKLREELKKPDADKKVVTELEGRVNLFGRNISNIARYLASEKQFLQALYELFSR